MDGVNDTSSALSSSPAAMERIVIDPNRRLIVLNYLSPAPDTPMVREPVPEGVDIFNLMNLSLPDNVSSLDGWSLVINPNSSEYGKMLGVFAVRKLSCHFV